jgi:ribonuclease HIII
MTFKIICTVINNQVIVKLPPDFNQNQLVTVLVDDFIDTKVQKMELLKNASKDPLFLEDVQEIHEDFSLIDDEV